MHIESACFGGLAFPAGSVIGDSGKPDMADGGSLRYYDPRAENRSTQLRPRASLGVTLALRQKTARIV